MDKNVGGPTLYLPEHRVARVTNIAEWVFVPNLSGESGLLYAMSWYLWLFSKRPEENSSRGWGSLTLKNSTTGQVAYLPLINGIPIPGKINVGRVAIPFTTVTIPIHSMNETVLLLREA